MSVLKYVALRAMFEAVWASHMTAVIRRRSKSRGVIFTLHRVLPDAPADFAPNAILQVTPKFLDFAIRRVRELDIDIVDMDEAVRRIEGPDEGRKFAVFTFDDAYRDNLKYALPVLHRHQCPFTLYVATALADGVGQVWWQALEDIISARPALAVTYLGETDYLPAATLRQKRLAYDSLYMRLRAMPEADRVTLMRDLAGQYEFDLDRHCRELIMDWSELKIFAADPLCTIGAHTVHHYELAKLPPEQAFNEIEQSIKVIDAQFGVRPRHLAYPIGGSAAAGPREFGMAREIGLRSAVTTIPGGLYHAHKDQLHALPRISLNGHFQSRRYIDVFATGALFTLAAKGYPLSVRTIQRMIQEAG